MAELADGNIGAIPRKVLVCLQKQCQICDLKNLKQPEIPDCCPYKVLHLLDTSRLCGLVTYAERDRQTGKTRELVEIANEAVTAGYWAYYIAPTQRMAEDAKRRFGGKREVKFMGLGQVDRHMRGMAPGFVLADEITLEEATRVRGLLHGTGHIFLAHYWTPR